MAATAPSSTCMSSWPAHARDRGRGAARDLADHFVGRVLDVDAAVQRRAAERELLRQRELELAQAREARGRGRCA